MKKTNKRPVKKSTGKKITIIVASLLAVALVGFASYWVVKNYNSVKAFFSGTQIYTATDIETAYQDGYTNALEDVTEYETLIDEYRSSINDKIDEISQLNLTITDLTSSTSAQEEIIETLEASIITLQTAINSLQEANAAQEETIEALQSQLSQIQTQYTNLQTYIEAKTTQIISLNSQITNLQNEINSLNDEVEYLETLLAAYENLDKLAVSFYVNGELYEILLFNENETIGINAIMNPVVNGYTFNYWEIDGIEIDLATFVVVSDISISANLTNVSFVYLLNAQSTGYTITGISSTDEITLTDYIIPNEYNGLPVIAIGNYAFSVGQNTNFHFAGSLIIPNTITSIGNGAFQGHQISSLVFEEDSLLTTIGRDAFMHCHIEEDLVLPESITSIGIQSFYGNDFENVVLPSGVTEIQSFAFAYCYNLMSLTIKSSNVVTLNSNALSNSVSSIKPIYVLVAQNLITAYESAANWSTLHSANMVFFVALSN